MTLLPESRQDESGWVRQVRQMNFTKKKRAPKGTRQYQSAELASILLLKNRFREHPIHDHLERHGMAAPAA